MALINHVLIDPTSDNIHFNGLRISDFVNPQRHVSVFGKVTQIPDKLIYHGDTIKFIPKTSQANIRKIQYYHQVSCEFKTKCEIKIDDTVLFKYGYQISNDEEKIGERLMIPYDGMYAAFRGDEVIMLNGYMLVEPLEKSVDDSVLHGMFSLHNKGISPGFAKIIHIGSTVEYLDYPRRIDESFLKKGDIIYFDQRFGVRVEWPLHNTLNPSGQPLMRIQRKDIFSY